MGVVALSSRGVEAAPIVQPTDDHVLGCPRWHAAEDGLSRYLNDDWCQGSGPYYRLRALQTFLITRPLKCPGCEDDYLVVMKSMMLRYRDENPYAGKVFRTSRFDPWPTAYAKYERYHEVRRLHRLGKVSLDMVLKVQGEVRAGLLV